MEYPIRATVPPEFDRSKHKVTLFHRNRIGGVCIYKLNDDGYYTSECDAGCHYAEGALLGDENMIVVEYKLLNQ